MDRLDEAFEKISRSAFLPSRKRALGVVDAPIPIGHGQTNSQPSTVHLMIEWLDPQPGDKVLDVGSGSGWTTALLGTLVGRHGHVYAVEKIPELVDFGEANCNKFNIYNARFFQAGKYYGLPYFAPFDRILVSAAAEIIPIELLKQLNIHGRMVIPINNTVHVIDKIGPNSFKIERHSGFVFVPLLK